jgi:hypothetical protein
LTEYAYVLVHYSKTEQRCHVGGMAEGKQKVALLPRLCGSESLKVIDIQDESKQSYPFNRTLFCGIRLRNNVDTNSECAG